MKIQINVKNILCSQMTFLCENVIFLFSRYIKCIFNNNYKKNYEANWHIGLKIDMGK